MALTESKRVLAVASGGGHWVQLLRLRPALAGCQVTYATVRKEYAADLDHEPLYVFGDATRWNKVALVKVLLQVAWIVARVRPDIVISTGAAPGYFAIRIGKLLGARTIWIDSIANVDEMSMTGVFVSKHADVVLTQWEHLVNSISSDTPGFAGAVV